jgi:hypothetical protein
MAYIYDYYVNCMILILKCQEAILLKKDIPYIMLVIKEEIMNFKVILIIVAVIVIVVLVLRAF